MKDLSTAIQMNQESVNQVIEQNKEASGSSLESLKGLSEKPVPSYLVSKPGEYSRDLEEQVFKTSSSTYYRISHRITITLLAKSLMYLRWLDAEKTYNRTDILTKLCMKLWVDGSGWFATNSCPELRNKEVLRGCIKECLDLFPEVTDLE